MKRPSIVAAALALATASGVAGAASWSVIVQPGVYGRVAIGGYAEAPLVYAPQPLVAIDNGYGQVVEEYVDPAYATDQTPVYLWVPEYQRLHWAEYCREYGAYGVPVYFVDDGWYRANVLRRAWTPEQRSWSPQQWAEQDRAARDRFERQRFEQQRYEQQQRWENERVWHDQQQQQQRRHDDQQQASWDHDRTEQDSQNRMRWGSARGFIPQEQQPSNQPRQQAGGGQWQQPGAPWQQGGNGGRQGGYQRGNAGQQPQPPSASQPQGSAHGAPVMPVQGNGADRGPARGDDRGQARGERGERRGQGEGRGAFEHGREGNRDR